VRDALVSRIRPEQTRYELELISKVIGDELQGFINNDPVGLHKTQLEAVRSVLTVAAAELRANLDGIQLEKLEVEEVYDLCRDYDEAIIWLHRLWKYLKEKFEQRAERADNAELANLLKSADEVVWSCYHEVLSKALGEHGAAPLTYIEPEYSPATVQTDKPLPVSLMLTAELDFLDQCLQSLPIPVLRLPPTCVSAPWWLIYIAHEVGHHIQYELDLVGYFRQGMTAAAEAKGLTKEEAATWWGNWGEEIFADIFSIMMMGEGAVRAMVEAEMSTPVKMVRRKPNYPAPVIRLALMEEVAGRLGLDVTEALLGLDLKSIAESDALSKRDYQVIAGAVEFALQPLPDKRGKLADLCLFDKKVYVDEGVVEGWGSVLSSDAELSSDEKLMRNLETARQVVCGSLRAWSNLFQVKDKGEREALRKTIKEQTIKALLKSGPRETRAGASPTEMPANEKGKELAGLLKSARKRLEKL
jgi:hypothetical protein